MRLVFPTNENNGYLSKRDAHFGKAKFYTVITLQNEKIVDVDVQVNQIENAGVCSSAVTNILNLKPDALIVSGIGASPAEQFAKAGLDLYFDTSSLTVQDSVKLFITNKLEKSTGNGSCQTN